MQCRQRTNHPHSILNWTYWIFHWVSNVTSHANTKALWHCLQATKVLKDLHDWTIWSPLSLSMSYLVSACWTNKWVKTIERFPRIHSISWVRFVINGAEKIYFYLARKLIIIKICSGWRHIVHVLCVCVCNSGAAVKDLSGGYSNACVELYQVAKYTASPADIGNTNITSCVKSLSMFFFSPAGNLAQSGTYRVQSKINIKLSAAIYRT